MTPDRCPSRLININQFSQPITNRVWIETNAVSMVEE